MKDEILPLFRDVLLVCQEMELLSGAFFALDGLKLPSDASKEWRGTRSGLQRKKERLEAKVKELLKEHVQEDTRDDPPSDPGGGDRERSVLRLQKQVERLEQWLKENKPRHGTTGQEISSNLTSNNSAKMKTAHGVIQGHNSQALIDAKHRVILHAEAFGVGQDYAQGPPCRKELGRISRAWAMVRSTLPKKSSLPTPTCGNARNCAWMPISPTGISAGGTPATRPNDGTGPGPGTGRGGDGNPLVVVGPV
jgi:hypothetical protein